MSNKKKVICFDIDGTLLEGNSWLVLTKSLNCSVEKHIELYEDTVSGRRPFEECERELVKLYRNSGKATKENIRHIYSSLTLRKESREVFDYLREKGFLIYLVSGSHKFFVESVARQLNPDGYYSNAELVFDKNDIVSKIDQHIYVQGEIKVEQAREIAKMNDISIKDIYFVGDGENDIDVFIATGKGISVHCSNNFLKKVAWKNIESLDELRSIFN